MKKKGGKAPKFTLRGEIDDMVEKIHEGGEQERKRIKTAAPKFVDHFR
jgi:hypothetical protein